MKTSLFMAVTALVCAVFADAPRKNIEVVAVYYPHWHQYPKGDEWFGADRWKEGEWTFVKSAKPRFPGHNQPLRPIPGSLDGKSPKDVATEIALAANAGIDVFLYDYYWYDGQVTQQEAIEEGFLKAPNRDRMKFALMWCYHQRVDAFRCPFGQEKRLLMGRKYAADELDGLIDYSIAHYFRTPEYWRKDGKLFFSIYNFPDFVKNVGAEGVKGALARARAKVRAAGLGEIEFNAQNVPFEQVDAVKSLGVDSLTHYGYNAYSVPGGWQAYLKGQRLFNFADAVEPLRARHAQYAQASLPYYPVVPTGWDATPRCRLEEPFPWKDGKPDYPYCGTFTNSTADVFERMLRDAKAAVERDPKRPGVVYINAWNEYTEGCSLLPDNFEADAKLRAIASVFGRSPANEYTYVNPSTRQMFTIPAPTHANLAYDTRNAKQKVDVWLPKGVSARTPLVVYIHGGGWGAGAMVDHILGSSIRRVLDAGIAVAAVGYRYIRDNAGEQPPVMAPLNDAEAALRFIKAHADEWRLDVSRIALTGGSAGAATALYLGFKNNNEHGIFALAPIIPQTSMDPQEMKAWIPNSTYGAHAFGYRSFAEWLAHRADCLTGIEKISGAALARKIDAAKAPKVFLQCGSRPVPGVQPKDPTHAGEFGVEFKKICDARGISCVLNFGSARCFGQAFDELIASLAERPVTVTATFMGPNHVCLRGRALTGVKRPDGGVAFTVKREEITPDVVDVEFHTPLAQARKGEEGYALAQRGLVFEFNKDELSWVQHRGWLYMPYYAMKTPRHAFIAVMEGMRFEHDLLLVSRKGNYEMFPRWKISEIGSAPYEDMTVVFYQLPQDADYNTMAKVYRSYKFAHDPTVRTLKERIRTRPHLATLAKSIALRQTHTGKPWKLPESNQDFTPTNEPPVRTHRTYDKTLDLLKRLKAAGVENVALCVAGWQNGGYDGRCPVSFPIEEGPGGEAGLRRLCEGGRALGYIIDGHSNYTDCFTCSPLWNDGDIACKKPDGSLFTNGAWSGGRAHNLCLKHAWETFLPGELTKIRALGFEGCHYVDVFTAVQPYRCCDPRHPANTREQMETQIAIAQRCHELFGGFSSECCMDHLLGYVDYINYVCAPMRGKRQAEAKGRKSVIDRFVPFFELAFHDVVLSNPDKITQEVLSQKDNLVLIEYGGRPIFYSISDQNLQGVIKAWEQFKGLRHLQLEEMVEHKVLVPGGEFGTGFARITYGNGEKIYVNHTDREQSADGITVPAMSFRH